MKEVVYTSYQNLRRAHIAAIVNAASEIYESNGHRPVRILDLATGPNGFNPIIVRNFVRQGIDYELILSDISPTHFRIGFENLERELSPDELRKVRCVLVDARDLQKNLSEVPEWGNGSRPLEDVLGDPQNMFLQTGYQDGRRAIDFSDGSFDMVIGCIPYRSINTGDYADAIRESARVLRQNGYHIVVEMHVEEVHSYGMRARETWKNMRRQSLREAFTTAMRSLSAITRARTEDVQEIKDKLDTVLTPVALHAETYIFTTNERIPEQTVQDRDLVTRIVLVHQKTN
jgi:hypothetical protein